MTTVIFDLDGTLIDSAPDIHAAANRLMAQLGQPDFDLKTVTSFIGNGVPVLVQRIAAARGLNAGALDDLTQRFLEIYAADPATLTQPYPGVRSALDALTAMGHNLGICTNKPEVPTRQILSLMGLADPFSAIVGGDTLACRKPSAEPLLHAMDLLKAGSCVYVGDSEIDAETAQTAGVPFVLFTGGYRKSPIDAIAHTASMDDFGDLTEIVARLA